VSVIATERNQTNPAIRIRRAIYRAINGKTRCDLRGMELAGPRRFRYFPTEISALFFVFISASALLADASPQGTAREH
jgi:hypothetical protein